MVVHIFILPISRIRCRRYLAVMRGHDEGAGRTRRSFRPTRQALVGRASPRGLEVVWE